MTTKPKMAISSKAARTILITFQQITEALHLNEFHIWYNEMCISDPFWNPALLVEQI
jgi:hypothetical protein